jgi:hypothetical protein
VETIPLDHAARADGSFFKGSGRKFEPRRILYNGHQIYLAGCEFFLYSQKPVYKTVLMYCKYHASNVVPRLDHFFKEENMLMLRVVTFYNAGIVTNDLLTQAQIFTE